MFTSTAFLFLQAGQIISADHEAVHFAWRDRKIPDLRPHVCKLSRNVVIQGDGESSEEDQYGVHTG